MLCEDFAFPDTCPAIIGATGGSGTRSLAEIYTKAGGYLGWDLNRAYDSLSLSSFFRSHMAVSFTRLRQESPDDSELWGSDFKAAMKHHLSKYSGEPVWGWKNPPSILFLPFLNKLFPSLKFVHLVRDGRDMALSENSNQYRIVNGMRRTEVDMVEMATYWSESNILAKRFGEKELRGRYLYIKFEDLCQSPKAKIEEFLSFVGLHASIDCCLSTIRKPKTIGRYHKLPREDIERLTEVARVGLTDFGYV